MKKSERYFLLGFLAILLISLPVSGTETGGGGDYDQQIETIVVRNDPTLNLIDLNLQTYSQLIFLFSNFKAMDISFGEELLKKVQRGDPLSGDEIYNLRRTITTYYKINQKILDFAKLYRPKNSEMATDFRQGRERLSAIKAHLIYLTGHILVLEHLVQMHKIYYETDPVFRRIVKRALLEKENSKEGPSKNLNDLIKMSQYTVEVGDSSQFAGQIILVRGIQEELKRVLENNPKALQLLNVMLVNPTATTIAQGKNNFKANYFYFVDTFTDFFNDFTNWLSSIFGNLAGSISWRNGHLKNNAKAITLLQNQLKPMDVIFDKSPFVLTDQFIPGHFGHVAVYLGTETQLKSIDMWEHPRIVPYQNEIKKGNVILEAVRGGVRLNSVPGFMNIDTFLLLRKEDGLGSPDILIDQISRGIDQMGKPYDFNFDVETLDKIVCSELIYIIFGNVHWPTKYRFGRATISPDDVAEIVFQKGTKFKMKTFLESSMPNMFGVYTIEKLANIMGYVARGNEGYFKKMTKCFTTNSPINNRTCQTTYKQDIYEEH